MSRRRRRQQHITCLWLLELLHWCLSVYAREVPSSTDPVFIKRIVDEHNKYRSQVSPPATDMFYMSWDRDLAKTALSWAQTCKLSHNPDLKQGGLHPLFERLGQNIWVASGNRQPEVKTWAAGRVNYDYGANTCATGKMCGQYTQVVWADTYKVGCGTQFCPTVEGVQFGNALVFVCDYGPTGNYRRRKPYTEGQSCTACPRGDKCKNNLCTNAGRDTITGSTTKPDSPGKPGAPGSPTSGVQPSGHHPSGIHLIVGQYLFSCLSILLYLV